MKHGSLLTMLWELELLLCTKGPSCDMGQLDNQMDITPSSQGSASVVSSRGTQGLLFPSTSQDGHAGVITNWFTATDCSLFCRVKPLTLTTIQDTLLLYRIPSETLSLYFFFTMFILFFIFKFTSLAIMDLIPTTDTRICTTA